MTSWPHISFNCDPLLNLLRLLSLILFRYILYQTITNSLVTVHCGICSAEKGDFNLCDMKQYSSDVNKIMKA